MSEHTPGPWLPGQAGNPRVYGPNGSGSNSGLLAVVYKHPANKYLIACAPELLDDCAERVRSDGFLIRCLEDFRARQGSWTLEMGDSFAEAMIANIRAHQIGSEMLIKKAEGER